MNVTVSLPDDLLREVRHLAVDRGMSLSKFVARVLEEQVRATRGYDAARYRKSRLLEKGLQLGTGGNITWTRDELHER